MIKVAAVVLAAGRSSRFHAAGGAEETKLVATLDGKPVVRHVVEAALTSRARPVIVVVGHARGAVEAALAGLSRDDRVQSGLRRRPCLVAAHGIDGGADRRRRRADAARRHAQGRGAAHRRAHRRLRDPAERAGGRAGSRRTARQSRASLPDFVRARGERSMATKARDGFSPLFLRATSSRSLRRARALLSTSTRRAICRTADVNEHRAFPRRHG